MRRPRKPGEPTPEEVDDLASWIHRINGQMLGGGGLTVDFHKLGVPQKARSRYLAKKLLMETPAALVRSILKKQRAEAIDSLRQINEQTA